MSIVLQVLELLAGRCPHGRVQSVEVSRIELEVWHDCSLRRNVGVFNVAVYGAYRPSSS
jgi:hypothetical protein